MININCNDRSIWNRHKIKSNFDRFYLSAFRIVTNLKKQKEIDVKKIVFFMLITVLSSSILANKIAKQVTAPSKSINEKNIDKDGGLNEGFEWEEMSPDWTIIDEDGDEESWILRNFNMHSGSKCMFVSYNADGNNDWLISPKLTIQEASELRLWMKSADSEWMESYNVLISESGSDISDFSTTLESVVDAPDEYTEKVYDLSLYAGKEIYVAVQCVSVDEYGLYLDDFSVSNCTWVAPLDEAAPELVSVNGNTAAVGDDLHLSLDISDKTGVVSPIVGTYTIDGNEYSVELTQAKDSYTFTGTVPASGSAAAATIDFDVKDTAVPENATNIEVDIEWINGIVEGFEWEEISPGWTIIDEDGDEESWKLRDFNMHSGSKCMYVNYNADGKII